MTLETKLDHIVKLLNYGDFPNRQELLDGSESLKSLLASSFSSESLLEAIKALKANPFYRQFKLDTDPQFLKALINKVDPATVIAKLFNLEINYSQAEKQVLEQQSLMLILDYGLKETIEFCTEADREEFEIYFEDLNELKALFSLEKITSKNIEWFLHSDLFDLIADNQASFDISLKDIYQKLLVNSKISTKKDFVEHKNVLIEKENKAIKDKEPFELKEFLSILNGQKKQIVNNLKMPFKASTINTFYKLPRANVLTPTARDALHNNLKRYIAFENQNSFKR